MMDLVEGRVVLWASVRAEDLVLDVKQGTGRRMEIGRYRFKGDFDSKSALVQVAVMPPWCNELTAMEIETCLTHPGFDCPDDDPSGCRLTKKVVLSPRWTPVVSKLEGGELDVDVWCAPLAPADGTKSVGEIVRADVDFHLLVMAVS